MACHQRKPQSRSEGRRTRIRYQIPAYDHHACGRGGRVHDHVHAHGRGGRVRGQFPSSPENSMAIKSSIRS